MKRLALVLLFAVSGCQTVKLKETDLSTSVYESRFSVEQKKIPVRSVTVLNRAKIGEYYADAQSFFPYMHRVALPVEETYKTVQKDIERYFGSVVTLDPKSTEAIFVTIAKAAAWKGEQGNATGFIPLVGLFTGTRYSAGMDLNIKVESEANGSPTRTLLYEKTLRHDSDFATSDEKDYAETMAAYRSDFFSKLDDEIIRYLGKSGPVRSLGSVPSP
jgi:hypothetical protein